ncbi:hypothetical protein VC83_07486 [Pseudogymnoascus destructans]|uniref:Uncharacterized protein n=1 Tax=Pseudogymnoascus destructans TaxID=655981 RepID=A0A177A5D1_9PEZI|nr:uncharacterized protein VC83_07486 [Pseudogymnoascus destructans]OAF56174.1 hypothetical protein VC83_07486 [Pseudogymnoascus destructans]
MIREPFMWSVLGDIDLVTWCLEHGASVFPRDQEPLRDDIITMSQRKCQQVLEKAAYSSNADPREEASRGEEEDKKAPKSARKYEVVGIDVKAPDQPPGRNLPDRWGTQTCYIPKSYGLDTDTRELAWFLLDRDADPTPALAVAKCTEHNKFIADVEAWRARQADRRKCCAIQ